MLVAIAWLALSPVACIQAPVPPIGGTPAEQFARLESQYADTRDLYFQIYITDARGTEFNARGASLPEMRRAHRALRERLLESFDALDADALRGEDRRALLTMRRQLTASQSIEREAVPGSSVTTPQCDYSPAALAVGDSGYARLSARLYACYGVAARRIVTPTDTSDRLTVLARLGTEPLPEMRRALFWSLEPMWRSVTGDGSPSSPYRTLLALSAARWRRDGSPVDAAARSLGLNPAAVESTLVRVLRAWRDHTPSQRVEPWDWYHDNGAASRILSPAVTRNGLREINDAYYRDQGGDPSLLNIHFDLDPREGKTPVAFTQFGKAARLRRGEYGESEAWVFATYRTGGFDNLVELLHETGHAIHVSGVAARPAYADWPDSDPFTEALGDLLALEAYEPTWQQRYLHLTAPASASLRAKYSAIALDVAWALLELRLHADPARDPNAEWAAITSEYLHIVPHPERGWWAMRGQLLNAPGYMMNYALGALITAQLRERIRDQRGPFATPDKKRYDWLSDHLYRFGLSRSSREVLDDVLGAPLGADAIVNDMRRLADR